MNKKSDNIKKVIYNPIGIIHSPIKIQEQAPIQPVFAKGIKGTVEIFPEYAEGLRDLNGFSHIYLLYYFHEVTSAKLKVTPFLDNTPRGVFATRAPSRPNAIGLSLLKLNNIHSNSIEVEDVDILDGTPLLDIKPFISRFDCRENARCGWQDNVDEETAQHLGKRNSRNMF